MSKSSLIRRHPLTGAVLGPLGYRKDGRPIFPILGGSEPPNQPPADPPKDPPADPPKPPADPPADKGFPEGTPLEQMNLEQQRNYWKHYARQHESRANARADYDDVKAKAAKSVNDAKDAGKREGAREAYAKSAAAVLKTSLTSRGKTAEQAQAVVDAANLAAFITDDGIDTAKVESFVNSIAAPVKGGGPRPDPSQGPRGDSTVSGVGAGRDLFAERHKPRQAAGTNA